MLIRPVPTLRWALDVLLAEAVGVLCWYAASESPLPPAGGVHEPAWVTVLVGVTLGAPLAVRRIWPVVVAVVVLVSAGVWLSLGVVPDYASTGPLAAAGITVYTVAVSVSGRRSYVVLVGSIATATAGMLIAGNSKAGPGRAEVAFVVVALGACWLVGWTLRERRASVAQATSQATAQAVIDERLRIAREIHDIVGHSLTVIAVKASIGSHVAEQRPEEASAALRVIASTSRGALTELRRAVGALRTEADFAPPPTLEELSRLAERAAEAGVQVDLTIQNGGTVPDGIALAAVRIVQESLTNVVKHVGPTTCRIKIRGGPGELQIEVANDGPPARSQTVDGAGLTGMRERVALHHGSLTAGPRAEGGFAVSATLPYEQTA
ncbi:sensor histidine kinase [Actinoplanes friuliensis]|uniref:sensor histidine kinase n=1 Tax=Actinoplanes friuliensis TaxID=196914 RepID=UPI00059F508B|nr:sensor histidine kinase [Actinoplanes friuliensis]